MSYSYGGKGGRGVTFKQGNNFALKITALNSLYVIFQTYHIAQNVSPHGPAVWPAMTNIYFLYNILNR